MREDESVAGVPAARGAGPVAAGGRAAAPGTPPRRHGGRRTVLSLVFLAPALVILGALVLYPIFFTVFRSLFDRAGDTFVGAGNYREMFTSPSTLRAIKNNAIWVVFAPTVVTALGLIFAVLSERVRWATAFKVVVFMPMAISFLAAGVIFRLVYEENPDVGLANAAVRASVEVFRPPGPYPGARPSEPNVLRPEGKALISTRTFSTGEQASLGLVGLPPRLVPQEAVQAGSPAPDPRYLAGVVWLDFKPGGGGTKGRVDPGEQGLPFATVQAVRRGAVVATTQADTDGTFQLGELEPGAYQIRIAEDTFREPFGGIAWLGPTLVTPAIIGSYIWIWAGFAMVVIAAGLAAIPRDVLEAARVDGGTEWQVFRRVTVPLLAPVLLVVLVTLIINVLKVFDLVLVIPSGANQASANVIALETWRVSFGGARDQGLGSALAVFLFLLVVPAMLFNIKRFRSEQ